MIAWLRWGWRWMLESPWRSSHRHDLTDATKVWHWVFWLVGWAWAIAGLLLGAFVAPSLAQKVGLANTQYEGTFEIGVAVVAGFLVQLAGWCVWVIATRPIGWLSRVERRHSLAVTGTGTGSPRLTIVLAFSTVAAFLIAFLLPFAAVGYALYRFIALVGPGQKLVTTAAVGGFLVKVFLIPFIKGIVSGVALKKFTDWVRGKPSK